MRSPEWNPSFDDPEIQEYLMDAAGEDGVSMFKFILDNEPITGVDIVEAHGHMPPSAVRKVLYKLMQEHALEYHKDTDSKGWETFHWATDLPEVAIIHRRRWQDEYDHLTKQLRYEQDHEFYACEQKHRRMLFENAMELDFHCPVCQEPMQPYDNQRVLDELQARIDELAPAVQV